MTNTSATLVLPYYQNNSEAAVGLRGGLLGEGGVCGGVVGDLGDEVALNLLVVPKEGAVALERKIRWVRGSTKAHGSGSEVLGAGADLLLPEAALPELLAARSISAQRSSSLATD
ncbi:hypothetical protein L596_024610 [Steinernema carpocapsae]|uniref:Uncharacterized protein n=1 Tax=Steinernema carpocapsae TaxID=34508 RepID=A0A4U5M5D5_STECR|nr:hypothetical protein L596_024610 [Steinernema carpocapsae]